MNEKEAEERIEEIYKLANKYLSTKKIYSENYEDLKQIMVFECWERLIKYFDESKAKLSTFCYMSFKTSLGQYVAHKNRKKRVINNNITSLDDELITDKFKNKKTIIETIPAEYIDPLEEYENELKKEEILKLIKKYDDRNILVMHFLEGKSCYEIARELSVTHQAISAFVINKRNKIKRVLNKGEQNNDKRTQYKTRNT